VLNGSSQAEADVESMMDCGREIRIPHCGPDSEGTGRDLERL
jgi:hypothetical protein